jgi:hypothetical protein
MTPHTSSAAAGLPAWRHDKQQICEIIAKDFATLKIILKTKDEPERLRTWIAHHAGVAGSENLIIFDHMSVDPAVLAIYAEHDGSFPIVRFDGFLNNIHNFRVFPELYRALQQNCQYYCFLDTDEYLVLYDGADRFEKNGAVLGYLARNNNSLVFPGTWLQGVAGHADRFGLEQPHAALSDGLKWGKPVISAAFDPSFIMLHNTEVRDAMDKANLKTALFVLHRHKNVPAERIRANMIKLKSYGAIRPDEELENVLKLAPDSYKMGGNYIREIQQLSALAHSPTPVAGSIEVRSDDTINWFSDAQRLAMQQFVAEPVRYSAQLFD